MTTAETATAPRKLRADAQRNYDALIEAARASFRDADADTSLEEIAKRAGVGIGTLYRHFPTRLALLEGVYRDEVDELDRKTEALLESAEPGPACSTRGSTCSSTTPRPSVPCSTSWWTRSAATPSCSPTRAA